MDRPIALIGATVLHGTGEPISDGAVLIEGSRISAVGERSEVVCEEAIDLTGHTVAPAFIDAHVHVGFVDPADVLRGGVAAVRDLGWPPERIFPIASRSRREPRWPSVVAAGQMLTAPGGYPTRAAWAPPGTERAVLDAEDAVSAVDEQIAHGACIVKIALNPRGGPVMDDDILSAVVATAHDRGLRVTAHIESLVQLERAIEAGVDELAHMLMGTETIPDDLIVRMADAGVVVVPTLAIRTGRELEVAIDNLARFFEAGGSVVYGTDLGNSGPRPGIDPTEVAAMAAAGMGVIDTVRSATSSSASWLGLEGGSIEAGAAADLVVFRGTPEDGAKTLQKLEMVWIGGERVT